MTFADLLKQYIGDRKLDNVVAACAERGVQIDAPLLSRMRQGTRLPPAEEHVVRVLADVCGGDPEPLVLLWQVERQPREAIYRVVGASAEALGSLQAFSKRLFALTGAMIEYAEESEDVELLELVKKEIAPIDVLREEASQASMEYIEMIRLVLGEEAVKTVVTLPSQTAQAKKRLRSVDDVVAELGDMLKVPSVLIARAVESASKSWQKAIDDINSGALAELEKRVVEDQNRTGER